MGTDWTKQYSRGELWEPTKPWLDNVTEAARRVLTTGVKTGGGVLSSTLQDGLLLIQNNSGADRKVGEILGIDNILVTPAKNVREFTYAPTFKGVMPAKSTHKGKFAVCAQAIKKGKLGWAFFSGTPTCSIDIANAADEWAEIVDGDATKLRSGASGSARILFKESGTGLKRGVIRLGEKTDAKDLEAVKVKKDGGSAGSDGTYPTFTYQLFDITDTSLTTPLASTVAVQRRPIAVECDPATDGDIALAYHNTATGADPAWLIVAIVEPVKTGQCDDGPDAPAFGF